MEISKRGFIALAACAIAASLFAGHHHRRPFPPGTPPGAYWCANCDGDGYYWTWYGWKRDCEVCHGRGWRVKKVPPPPPQKKVAPPHHPPKQDAHKPAPASHKPAPASHKSDPAPHGSAPKGGLRR